MSRRTNPTTTVCPNCRQVIKAGEGTKVNGNVYICPDCMKAWRP